MKRILAFILLAVLLLGAVAPAVYATEEETTAQAEETLDGWFGEDFKWVLEDGTLTISGYGAMSGEAPWRQYSEKIETVVFEDTVSTVSAGAFRECTNLKEIDFGSSMKEIGDYAFQGCTALKEIRLPDTFRRFGVMSFGGCTSLETVFCTGYMPRFEESCLWNEGTITIYYTQEKPWAEKDVEPLVRSFGGRLEVLSADGAEEKTAETIPAATQAPTVPATVATEPPVTVPETTVPETVPVAATLPEILPEPTVQMGEATEPVAIEEETVRGGFVGLALILGVVTFFIVGALLFKSRSRGGRY